MYMYLEAFNESKMPAVDSHVAFWEMNAVVQGIANENRERDSLDDPEGPTEHAENAEQGEEDRHDGEKHGENEPPVVWKDGHDQRTETERDEDAIDWPVDCHQLNVDLDPILPGLEGRGEKLMCTSIESFVLWNLSDLTGKKVFPFLVLVHAGEGVFPRVACLWERRTTSIVSAMYA